MKIVLRIFTLLFCLLVGYSTPAGASVTSPTSITGAVYKKQTMRTPEGYLTYVELDEKGLEVADSWSAVADPNSEYWWATTYSASYYNSLRQQYQMLLAQYFDADEDATAPVLMSRQQYEDARTNNTFVTVNNEPMTSVPELETDTVTVVVVHPDRRYETDGSKLVLLQLPINPEVELQSDTKSVLISVLGRILHESSHIIGYRSGYFEKDGNIVLAYERDPSYEILGPLYGVSITGPASARGAVASTGTDGTYALTFNNSPCVGLFYSLSVPITARLNVRQFNPKSSTGIAPLTMTKDAYDLCSGFSEQAGSYTSAGLLSRAVAMVIEAGMEAKNPNLDFPVDLILLNGRAQFRGPIVQGEAEEERAADGSIISYTGTPVPVLEAGQTTTFDSRVPQLSRARQQHYDFDGDGASDAAWLGRWGGG